MLQNLFCVILNLTYLIDNYCFHAFICGNDTISYVDNYTYLGVILTEHLDFDYMAKKVAQSASRALGLLIAKAKLFGGLFRQFLQNSFIQAKWLNNLQNTAIFHLHSVVLVFRWKFLI